MARRADHTREELKELATEAGLALIKNEGLAEFSARKVATDIGYTVGTLYNVFGNYDTLILHINARTLDEWFAVMQGAQGKTQGKKALHALARSYIEYSRAHYRQWSALFEYHLSDGSTPPQWYVEKMERFFMLVETPLKPLLNNNAAKTQRAARTLWAGIHGICVLSLSGKLSLVKSDSAEVLALAFVDDYLFGLCGKS